MREPECVVETRGAVAIATLNRPAVRNALNDAAVRSLMEILDRVEADAGLKVLIITGAGRAFCAGDDLRGMTDADTPLRLLPDPVEQYVRGEGRWPLIVDQLRSISKPVIGRINEDVLLLDPRTVLPEEDEAVITALRDIGARLSQS